MFDLQKTSCLLLYEYTYCKKVTNDSKLRDKFEKQRFQRRFVFRLSIYGDDIGVAA